MRKPASPSLDDHPELAILALLHETLQLAELALIATDRNIVDDDHPFHLPPRSRIAQAILGQGATPELIDNVRERLGLNQPAYLRYFTWLGNLLSGELGTSLANGADIADMLGERIVNTGILAGLQQGEQVAIDPIAAGVLLQQQRGSTVTD